MIWRFTELGFLVLGNFVRYSFYNEGQGTERICETVNCLWCFVGILLVLATIYLRWVRVLRKRLRILFHSRMVN